MVDRKLGRGLDFFLSEGKGQAPAQVPQQMPSPAVARAAGLASEGVAVTLPAGLVGKAPGADLRLVPVGELSPNPRQPRGPIATESLGDLVQSIRSSGVLQPILVRRVGGKLEIVAGERRWRAAKEAGLLEVPVVVRTITDEESGVFALVENLQREDLNAIEKAKAFRQLLAQLQTNQEELGRRVGLDRSTVANFIRLLELAPAVQDHVSRGTLSMGHARALLAIREHEVQAQVADDVIRRGLSVRALEELMRSTPQVAGAKPEAKSTHAAKKAAWLKEVEESLCEALGTPIAVRYGKKTSMITITCAGRDEFERVLNKLKNC